MSARDWIAGALLAVVPVTIVVLGTDDAHGADRPVHTKVLRVSHVSGSQETGYWIRYDDGSAVRMPSLASARAECRDGRDSEGEAAYRRCNRAVTAQYRALLRTDRYFERRAAARRHCRAIVVPDSPGADWCRAHGYLKGK